MSNITRKFNFFNIDKTIVFNYYFLFNTGPHRNINKRYYKTILKL